MKKFEFSQLNRTVSSRNSSVAARFDDFSGLLHLELIEAALGDDYYNRWLSLSGESYELGLLYYMLVVSGCRVSELLSLSFSDVINYHQVIIRGKKGSNSREFSVLPYVDYFKLYRGSPLLIFRAFNYAFVRRAFIRHNIGFVDKNSKNKKITHAPRHQKISQLYKSINELSVVQEVIGHKSQKSTAHYLGLKK